ncbi:hypothetical protein [Nitrospira moscoviensis]|uniref:Uncharacterized protein n=1 Tax=Nitrospira moscoviensis TaxID=42253 RepID=A0A0K2G9T9_NITMO|nr:hypothetical protein [Nitrospira moscoviensis]ALA57736.1 hypothetical protein NITMOv2_1308 [Nitrospira moscoviensis]
MPVSTENVIARHNLTDDKYKKIVEILGCKAVPLLLKGLTDEAD